ncbi:hypothetical protein Nepgr_022144 [Nepenthes gracilis]|uniref:Uncharacterized protein n=1 Tax=Nepenthes gracilis TaxID=150966 RepID=A0AAD3SZV3_NEPGR|nr:hypothetical protein Nepgr_022144 [Nepenthes gracilis]
MRLFVTRADVERARGFLFRHFLGQKICLSSCSDEGIEIWRLRLRTRPCFQALDVEGMKMEIDLSNFGTANTMVEALFRSFCGWYTDLVNVFPLPFFAEFAYFAGFWRGWSSIQDNHLSRCP